MHGRRAGDLLDEVLARLPTRSDDDHAEREQLEKPDAPRVAIVGRPNVGKSTLFNRLVGEDRSVVHDMAGTTRDAVDTLVETEDGPIVFVDTAGMRRRSRIDDSAEYYSLVRALRAVDESDIALLVIDAAEGVTSQDQRLAAHFQHRRIVRQPARGGVRGDRTQDIDEGEFGAQRTALATASSTPLTKLASRLSKKA